MRASLGTNKASNRSLIGLTFILLAVVVLAQKQVSTASSTYNIGDPIEVCFQVATKWMRVAIVEKGKAPNTCTVGPKWLRVCGTKKCRKSVEVLDCVTFKNKALMDKPGDYEVYLTWNSFRPLAGPAQITILPAATRQKLCAPNDDSICIIVAKTDYTTGIDPFILVRFRKMPKKWGLLMVPAEDHKERVFFEKFNKKNGSKLIPLHDRDGKFDLFIAYNAKNKIAGPMSLEVQTLLRWTQIGDDIDGENALDQAGRSVALSSNGSVVAIGATGNDGNGSFSGHVRVYQNVNRFWVQVGDDIDGEVAYDWSGYSVALSSDGSILAVGAINNDGNGDLSGQVRVYQNVNGSWYQVGNDIDGKNSKAYSGWSVSLSSDGSVVATGGTGTNNNGVRSGHVQIYRNVNGSWNQVGDDINGESEDDWFGISVALSSDGSVVAIGAHRNDNNGLNSGHVQIYQNVNESWNQLGDDIDGENAGERSGETIALSSDGSVVAIGAPGNNGNGFRSKLVRVFQNVNGSWDQVGNDINGENTCDRSVMSVALSSDGSVVAIGSEDLDYSGSVRVYKNVNGSWDQVGDNIEGENAVDQAGRSVALSSDGNVVAVGAIGNDDNGLNSGHVRIFEMKN